MPGGIEVTFRTLAHTPNESAVPVLIAGIGSTQRHIQELALRALLERRSPEGHREIIQRWDTFSEHFREIVCERSGRIGAALRSAIVAEDNRLAANGCAVAVAVKEFDLIPVLLAVAEPVDHPHGHQAAQTLLELAELLHEELALPRDYRERRDPQLMRKHIVGSLETALSRAELHRRGEIVEAFLLLANSDNSTLRQVLDDLGHPAHGLMCEALRTSPRAGVMRIILKYLEKPSAPVAVLQIVAQRRDIPFLRRLAKHLGPDVSEPVQRNLRRIDRIAWSEEPSLLLALNDAEQMAAMRITNATGADRAHVFQTVQLLLRQGNVGGRRAAAEALAQFEGVEANESALAALNDEDALVQANTVKQLRDRAIPGAMAKLVTFIDSPSPEIRQAAQQALQEFSYARYNQAFDTLDEQVRRSTGTLVRKVDPSTIPHLKEELSSTSRIRRQRGLQMAVAMGAAAELEQELLEILGDDDQFLRAEAATALGGVPSERVQQALREALADPSPNVQEAADAALRVPPDLSATRKPPSAPPIELPPSLDQLPSSPNAPS